MNNGIPTLRRMSRGSEVVSLQLMLREIDYVLEPDGIFGPMTREAVVSFQATHGLPPLGEVDPATWEALEICFADAQDIRKSSESNDSELFDSVRETGLEQLRQMPKALEI